MDAHQSEAQQWGKKAEAVLGGFRNPTRRLCAVRKLHAACFEPFKGSGPRG